MFIKNRVSNIAMRIQISVPYSKPAAKANVILHLVVSLLKYLAATKALERSSMIV